MAQSLVPGISAGLSVVGVLSLPFVRSVILQLRGREHRPQTYADKDGEATPESTRAYSAKAAKTAVVLLAVAGTALSIILALWAVQDKPAVPSPSLSRWLGVAAWVCAFASSPRPHIHIVALKDVNL